MSKSKPSNKATQAKKSSKKEQSTTLPRRIYLFIDEHFRKIVGTLLLFLSVFLSIAVGSYLFTWKADQHMVLNRHGVWDFLFDSGPAPENAAGKLGAVISHWLVYRGFGLAILFLLSFLFIWSLNLLLKHRLVSSLKAFFNATLLTLLSSTLLAYYVDADLHPFPFGGDFGLGIVREALVLAGTVGTALLMGGLSLIWLIVLFGPIARLPFWQRLLERKETPAPIPAAATRSKAPKGASLEIDDTVYAETPSLDELITGEQSQMPESFWHEEPAEVVPAETALPENAPWEEQPQAPAEPEPQEIELEPVATPLPQETPVAAPESDLTLEVVKIDEPQEIITNSHITVAGDEPYDPSLELRNYKFPTIDLLEHRSNEEISIDKNELEQNKNQIINTLKSFGIAIAKISATVGPTVTLYEIVPAEGVRISKIRNLEDDIALSLSALGIRIIAPIPGKGTIGIEVPNLKKQFVSMRTLLASERFIHNDFSLPIALGKKIDNENFIVDLAKMPHLLMAGATGQGKSVGINTILVSLLYKKHPSQLKFVMVDPKKVELSIYKHIEKHFLAKLPNEEDAIITDTKKVINTLNALCIEMDNRYDLLKDAGVRNIREYNDKFIKRKLLPTKGHKYLPFIVLVVDEFADLIMTAGKEVEMPIARIAQLARAVGIHCIIATQRPSVNVITGTIKANFPARVAFKVSAKVDSRTILDAGGAEQLIGQGDMLILNGSELVRLQCAFVDTPEVERIVEYIGNQQGYPTAFDLPEYEGADGGDLASGGSKSLKDVDQMFEQCARLVVSSGSGSTSMLQRRFNLGYNRAGRIMDQLEAAGIVGATTGGKPRELLIQTEAELEEVLQAINRMN